MQLNSKTKIIKKTLVTILLNSCSIDSINLNNGKLGLSLCLFEVAKYLNDESVEDATFNLLQEVLAFTFLILILNHILILLLWSLKKENAIWQLMVEILYNIVSERPDFKSFHHRILYRKTRI